MNYDKYESCIDFIPSEEYTDADAAEAIRDANFVVRLALKAMSWSLPVETTKK